GSAVGSGNSPGLSLAMATTKGSSGYRAGLPVAARQISTFAGGALLKPSTSTQSHGPGSASSWSSVGSPGASYSRILASRRLEATTTSKAPAWRCRQESLPSWSMSNAWCACLTTETRRPASRSRAMSCSTSVVLPEPEYPQNPTTFIFRDCLHRCGEEPPYHAARPGSLPRPSLFPEVSMHDFWPGSGLAQLERTGRGWLQPTDAYWRLYLALPELAPV